MLPHHDVECSINRLPMTVKPSHFPQRKFSHSPHRFIIAVTFQPQPHERSHDFEVASLNSIWRRSSATGATPACHPSRAERDANGDTMNAKELTFGIEIETIAPIALTESDGLRIGSRHHGFRCRTCQRDGRPNG